MQLIGYITNNVFLLKVQDLFKSDVNTLVEKIQQLQDKAKKAEKELQGLKEKPQCKRVPI